MMNYATTGTSRDHERLNEAYRCALDSVDPSTQNGAVLEDYGGHIIARACNEFPKGVAELRERWERPLKYAFIEHAERNAIYQAGFVGRSTHLATLYCPWAACADCARAIIQSGIRRLVRHEDAMNFGDANPTWDASIAIADTMLHEAGVEILEISGPITDGLTLRHSGRFWTP